MSLLLPQNLVLLIERDADQLTRSWLEIVRGDPETPSYHAFDEHDLCECVHRVYSELGRWISRETTKEEIGRYFIAIGAQRCRQGFRLSEVIKALTITRRLLWFKVLEDGLLDTAVDLHLAIQLNNHVIHFFDRAVFFATVGYEREGGPRPAASG